MENYGLISSIETLPLPEGMHVKEFDDIQKARKIAEGTSKKLAATKAATSGQVDLKLPSDMSYPELDSAIDAGLSQAAERLIPYLLEMRDLLSQQGKRTDLRRVPEGMTWQRWVETKKKLIGSLSTVNRVLAEATDEKKACPKCGKKRGHLRSCPHYVAPEPKPLTALESKFVDASLKQHTALQEFYGGRTDADSALKSIAATVPAHDKLEEYVERGSDAVETNKKLEAQQQYISELGEEITRLNEENEILQNRLAKAEAVGKLPTHDEITNALAAEPDTDVASKMLTDYLTNVTQRVLPAHVTLSHVGSTVKLAGRPSRIMPGDYLEYQRKNEKPILCKCSGIGEFMSRRTVSEWKDGKWGKEHVVFSGDESKYRVITEEAARDMEPKPFE